MTKFTVADTTKCETTTWAKDFLTKWLSIQNDLEPDRPNDQMTKGWNDMLVKWPIDKIRNLQNDHEQLASWWNDKLTK